MAELDVSHDTKRNDNCEEQTEVFCDCELHYNLNELKATRYLSR